MQKFNKGDWVRVAKDLGSSMSHFTADCEAIILGSYADQYGGNDHSNYSLYIKDKGPVSWYHEPQLTLIESGRLDKLAEWEAKQEEECKQASDMDWVFAHGADVLENAHGATILALAKCFGLTNLWGKRGEGVTYYSNAIGTLNLAEPFLLSGDKDGWLAYAETLKRREG